MERIYSRTMVLIAIISLTVLAACTNQKQEGSYAYRVTGFDDSMEGYVVKLTMRDLKTFKYETTDVAVISQGEFAITDSISFPRTAIWSIYNGEKMQKKGNIILEPGTYSGDYVNKEILMHGTRYNQSIYYELEEDSEFKAANKTLNSFRSSLDQNKVSESEVKQVRELYAKQDQMTKNYYAALFNSTNDLNMKLLSCLVGRLYSDEGSYLADLEKLADGHVLIAQMKGIVENQKRAEAMSRSLVVGKSIKSFSAKNLDGETTDLADILSQNKYVLVEFWASWCGPCRAEIPHMKTAYQNFNQKGFEIVSFSLDHKMKNWRKASDSEQLPWLNISDLLAYDSPVTKMYGIQGIPANFLVEGSSGKIVALDLRQKALDDTLEDLLN